MRRVTAPGVFIRLMASLIACGVAAVTGPDTLAQKPAGRDAAPRFEVDPLWPKPLPNHWVLGSIGGIAVDEQDHVWILHRGSRTLAENFKQLEMNPPWAMCCRSAPEILEFDQEGNVLRHWGAEAAMPATSGWTRNTG